MSWVNTPDGGRRLEVRGELRFVENADGLLSYSYLGKGHIEMVNDAANYHAARYVARVEAARGWTRR